MLYNKKIDNGRGFDWGLASENYAKCRDIYPDEFYRKIVDLGCCVEGQKVLDLATGTGVLPRHLYPYGADFVGTDISENQIDFARELSAAAGMNIQYMVSAAEDLDFPDETFDVVTACQCFMYFDDKIIFPKIHQFLKDNGHFLILFMSWLPDESEIAMASERLVLKYNPDWNGCGMQRRPVKAPENALNFFEVAHAISFDLDVPFTRESWNGRIKACRGIGASSLSAEQIAAWEKEHLDFLETVPERFNILHYVTILDLKKKALNREDLP